jgi:hypothetical protein
MTDSFVADHTDDLDWPVRPASVFTVHGVSPDDNPVWLKYVDDTLDMLKAFAHDHVEVV